MPAELLKDNQRVRSCRALYYGDMEELKGLCEKNCSHYALSLHDKDVNDDGTLKKAHIHCILRFGVQFSCAQIMKRFGEQLARPFLYIESEFCRYFDYLTHEDETDKVHYPQEQVVCDDVDYWEREYNNHSRDPPDCDNVAEQIINDMIATVPTRELVKKYGREIVINYKYYRNIAGMVYYEESLRNKGVVPVSIEEEQTKQLNLNLMKGE